MNKISKQIIGVFLVLAMTVSMTGMLVGCTGNTNPTAPTYHTTHADKNDDGKCDECGVNLRGGAADTTPSTDPTGEGSTPMNPQPTEDVTTPTEEPAKEGPELWDTTAAYVFSGKDGARGVLYLFHDGSAKFMPSRYYEEYYTGSWTVVDGTVKFALNLSHDADVAAGNPASPVEYPVTVDNNEYTVTVPSTRGEFFTLVYSGDAITAPSEGGSVEIPQEEWPEKAIYIFTDASGRSAALYLLPFGIAKFMASTTASASPCTGTWTLEGDTFHLAMDIASAELIQANKAESTMKEYTIAANNGAYNVTLTYLRGSADDDREPVERTAEMVYTGTVSAPVTGEPESNVRKTELHFARDGLDIYGTMYLPAEEKDVYPTIILSHGLNNSSDRFEKLATFFAENGYAAYAFDFCGGGNRVKSEGETTDMSVLTEAADLTAVLNGVLQLSYVDSSNLFLFGQSQGGYIATYVAGQNPDLIKGLMLYFPAYSIKDDAEKAYPDPSTIPEVVERQSNFNVGRIYYLDAVKADIYAELGKFAANHDVIICHGDQDTTVDISYSQKAANMYERVTLNVIPGSGHGFNREPANETLTNNYILEYLQNHIG